MIPVQLYLLTRRATPGTLLIVVNEGSVRHIVQTCM